MVTGQRYCNQFPENNLDLETG